MKQPEYLIIYEQTPTGWSAYVPDLTGCVAAGRTRRDTERLMRGAIAMHLQTMLEDGDHIPRPTTSVGSIAVRLG